MSMILTQLDRFGPGSEHRVSLDEAREWCHRQVGGQYENFSVVSRLLPRRYREDFAAIYAFCRGADDLGDESGSQARSIELLQWWDNELEECYAGRPRHPVFVALRPVIERCELPIGLFKDLISAFVQDQTITRYDTWDQLLDYCRRSADPVGRLVLRILGEPLDPQRLSASDAICTALQLTNHWQDVRRDFTERNRIYIPREINRIPEFESRLAATIRQGYAVDHQFLGETRALIRSCVDRTWKLYEKGLPLVDTLSPASRPVVWLFSAGGMHVLRLIEMWNCETILNRPVLSTPARAWLLVRAWFMLFRLPVQAA